MTQPPTSVDANANTNTNTNANANPPAVPSPAPAPADKPKSRWRTWRRRLIRTALVVIGVVLLLRVSLVFLLPWAVNRAAAHYGLTCRYEHMDLYLIDGDVGLWHVVLGPTEGGTPFVRADYCRAEISTLQLLRGRLHVQQLVADGPELNIERQADGRIPLLSRLSPILARGGRPAGARKGVDLESPLQIDALRLQHVSTHVHDAAVTPPLDANCDMDLRLSDLGSPTRPARLWLQASSSPLLDVIRVDGTGTSGERSAEARFDLFVSGLHAKPAAGYLAPLGIVPVADGLSATAHARLKLAPATAPAAPPDAVAGQLELQGLALSADGSPAAAVDRVLLDAVAANTATGELKVVAIDGVRVDADRTPDGRLRLAGFELRPLPTPATHPAAAPEPAIARSAVTQPTFQPPPVRLDEIDFTRVALRVRDASVTPPAQLEVNVPAATVRDIDTDPGHAKMTTVDATVLIPGVLQTARLSGSAVPFAPMRTATFQFQADGIRPDVIRPYLEPYGVRSRLENASLTCRINAAVSTAPDGTPLTDASLTDVHFKDGGDLLTLDRVGITGLGADAALSRVRVADVQIVGPQFAARRGAGDVLSALGFEVDPSRMAARNLRPAASPVAAAPTPTPATGLAASLPRVDVGHLAWKGVRLQLTDEGVQPASTIDLSDAGLELSEVHFDPNGPPADARPGKFRAWLRARGLADDLLLDGTLTPAPQGIRADLAVSGRGLRAALLAPYLKSLGVEPILDDGSVQAHAVLDVRSDPHAIHASGSVTDVSLAQHGTPLAGVRAARIEGLELAGDKLAIDSLAVSALSIRVERDETGAFRAVGFKKLLSKEPSEPEGAPAVQTASAQTTRPATSPAPAARPLQFAINRLSVQDAALAWSDRAVTPPVNIEATADVTLGRVAFAPDAPPAELVVTARAPQIADDVKLSGTVQLAPTAAAAKLDFAAGGLKAGPLASYLPPGVTCELKDGRLNASLDAGVAENPAGGAAGHVVVTGVNYHDGEQGPTLLKFDTAQVKASRIDLPGGQCALDEITVAGLETAMSRGPGGTTRLLGLSMGAAPPARAAAPPAPPAPAAPASPPVPASQPTTPKAPEQSAASLMAAHHRAAPLFSLDRLDIGIRRVDVVDLTRPAAAPLTLADAHLSNRAPIRLLGPDPLSNPPVRIRVDGRAEPLIGKFLADLDATPFAARAGLQLDVTAGGIRGDGLTALVPELKPTIDGSPLTNGEFHTHLEAEAQLYRTTPASVDLTRPFDLTFSVTGTRFKDASTGTMLAGLDEVRSDAVHVAPDRKLVQVRSLEMTTPMLVAFRDPAGIHALGLIYKLPAETPSNKPAEQAPPAPEPAGGAVLAAAHEPPARQREPSGEVRIAKLTVSGLDVRIEDRAVAPPALITLNGLEAEVRGLSSRAMDEELPVRFNLLVNGGKVTLPKHKNTGAITGAMADVRAINAGQKVNTAPHLEQRDLFAQLDAAGDLALYPHPKGWVKSSISGLELGEFKGEAVPYGVTLEEGTFDYTADLRFPGDGTMDARVRPVFSDLSVTEAPNGPIVRSLHLPAPLDVVLAALRDPEGGIALPVDVKIKQGKLTKDEVTGAAIGAAGAVIATAVAAAPAKAASAAVETITDVASVFGAVGLTNRKPGAEPPIVISFAPGDTALPAAGRSQVTTAIEKLRKDDKLELTIRHQLTAADVTLASTRANPSPDEVLQLAARLRARRSELQSQRAQLQGRGLVTLVAAGGSPASADLQRLRAVEQELAGIEDGLDRLYEMLRPGADRLSGRRTRQAALQIAQAREDAVRAAVLASGLPHLTDRVRVVRPQFTPNDAQGGGEVTLVMVKKK